MTKNQRNEKKEELENLTRIAFEQGKLTLESLEKIKENLIKKSA